jgi:hypothetical protein
MVTLTLVFSGYGPVAVRLGALEEVGLRSGGRPPGVVFASLMATATDSGITAVRASRLLKRSSYDPLYAIHGMPWRTPLGACQPW